MIGKYCINILLNKILTKFFYKKVKILEYFHFSGKNEN